MASSGSPTVRRRRLAAELRRLRGNRTGNDVSRAIGWSTTKISRAESGRESLPPPEIEKLIDYYGVADPLRGRLLELAGDAAQRGWWDDYADVLTPEYLEFIGLEAEAVSCLQWHADVIPGLLQTEEYARQLNAAYRAVDPTVPPSVQERFLQVRMLRQARLTQEPVLRLSVVMDEAVLLRGVGDLGVMRAQLARLIDVAELPNVNLRVLPLKQNAGLHGGSFAIVSFRSQEAPEEGALGDVVSTENLNTEFYVQGENDTYLYRLFFQALFNAALPPAESRRFIISTIEHAWS
ncbi:MAG TPA: helix-turn-helix transcriptional regulator [Trebonia sp.]